MVANAEKQKRAVAIVACQLVHLQHALVKCLRIHHIFLQVALHIHQAIGGLIGTQDAAEQHLAAIGASPAQHMAGHIHFMGAGTVGNILIHARFAQDLGNVGIVAEGIHIIAGAGGHAKLIVKIPLAVKAVAGKAFAGGQIAIGLHKPAINNNETTLLDPGFDLLKHGRVKFLHPFKHLGCAANKGKLGKFLHTVKHRAQRGLSLTAALLPPPHPHGVDVGIAHKIEIFDLHGKRLLFCFQYIPAHYTNPPVFHQKTPIFYDSPAQKSRPGWVGSLQSVKKLFFDRLTEVKEAPKPSNPKA